jgi:hypothetical protein
MRPSVPTPAAAIQRVAACGEEVEAPSDRTGRRPQVRSYQTIEIVFDALNVPPVGQNDAEGSW